MSKNPIINSLSAYVYILLIVTVLNYGTKLTSNNTFMAPIAMISLFRLSAAIMAYIFCFQPLQLFLDGKKKIAVKIFLQTTALFACLTILSLVILFFNIFG